MAVHLLQHAARLGASRDRKLCRLQLLPIRRRLQAREGPELKCRHQEDSSESAVPAVPPSARLRACPTGQGLKQSKLRPPSGPSSFMPSSLHRSSGLLARPKTSSGILRTSKCYSVVTDVLLGLSCVRGMSPRPLCTASQGYTDRGRGHMMCFCLSCELTVS